MLGLGDVDFELVWLAFFHGLATYGRDRQRASFVENTNMLTGLPESRADMLSDGQALRGPELALGFQPAVDSVATSMLSYKSGASEGSRRSLSLAQRSEWTEEAKEAHAAISYELKVAAHRLASWGLMNVQPLDHEEKPQPLGADGLCTRVAITWEGLKEAKNRVKGTQYETMRFGWNDAVAAGEKHMLPDWVRKGD